MDNCCNSLLLSCIVTPVFNNRSICCKVLHRQLLYNHTLAETSSCFLIMLTAIVLMGGGSPFRDSLIKFQLKAVIVIVFYVMLRLLVCNKSADRHKVFICVFIKNPS